MIYINIHGSLYKSMLSQLACIDATYMNTEHKEHTGTLYK